MNCKPGDLAVIVCPADPSNNGRVITVTQLHEEISPVHGVAWRYEGTRLIDPCGRRLAAIYDCWLRPIRNPGDDAVDESKAWLPPVPTGQTDKVSERPPTKEHSNV